MEDTRQEVFQKLRPACVELSSVALKFRGRHGTVKSVSQTLEKFYEVLKDDIVTQNLNEKLAEYAFFPLTHIFNESQRLSSRCLELAVLSLQILVNQGWREKLSPEMGKQLLLLLTLLAGGSSGKNSADSPSEDLKVAAFSGISTVASWLGASQGSKTLFNDVSTKNIVDQLVFLLLEATAEDTSDTVQLAASKALLQVSEQISNRLLLASLLPRTVSTLTKVLRPSTQHRRTSKVLVANLVLLRITLQRVLGDSVASIKSLSENSAIASTNTVEGQSEVPEILDQSWLKATSAQVKIALTHVARLSIHDRTEVRLALSQLCLMILEDCSESLADCASIMLETLVFLDGEGMPDSSSSVKYLLTARPSLIEELNSSLQRWIASLPRLMQASDDRPRQRTLFQVSQAVQLLSSVGHTSSLVQHSLATTLIDSAMGAIMPQQGKMITSLSEPSSSLSQLLLSAGSRNQDHFSALTFGQKSQQSSLAELQALVISLGSLEQGPGIARAIIDTIPVSEGNQQLSAIWLAVKLLSNMSSDVIDDFVVVPHGSSEMSTSKPFLISDLYAYTLPLLLEDDEDESKFEIGWQAQALALECLILQADQLGISYRHELIDGLYPALAFLGSQTESLQQHAMVALNLLSNACQYSSVTDLLVDNVDYLVNSIALKLNSSNLAPQAPQVLLIMVRLCGARLIPYLDDLIGSIFMALDDFHGYSKLVELLFEVLGAIVDEGARQPALAITQGKEAPAHRKARKLPSNLDDIVGDLIDRRGRKRKLEGENEEIISAPRRPWSNTLDGPKHEKTTSDEPSPAVEDEEDEMMPPANPSDEKETPLSKSHQLLLSIGQATTPHLSSPSPKVRHTLLNLLDRITPLLAKDENSFLPLINAIWPSLTARLFGEIVADGDGEAAFNVCAGAETIARLCEGAGDFMASRIEEIFPQLQSLWKKTWSKVENGWRRQNNTADVANQTRNLAASVDLQLIKPAGRHVEASSRSSNVLAPPSRTTDAQILNALVTLLTSILDFVRITDDNGDAVLHMLAPIMDKPGREDVREALESWNADAVWLIREKRKIEHEIADGSRVAEDWTWCSDNGLASRDDKSSFLARTVVF